MSTKKPDVTINVKKENDAPEGNRTVTLHNRSWVQIVRLLNAETEATGNPTPATIANTIEAQGVDFIDG